MAKKKVQLLFTSRNCAVYSFLDFFNDTKSYANYVKSYNVIRNDKLVWIRKYTEVYGDVLNLGYPKYEAQILATKFTTLCTNRRDNGIIAGPEFLTLSPSDPLFSKGLQPQQGLSTIYQYIYIQQDATVT